MGVRKELSLYCTGERKKLFFLFRQGSRLFPSQEPIRYTKNMFLELCACTLVLKHTVRVLNSSSCWAFLLSFSLGFGRHRISLPFPYLPPRRQDRAVSINCNPGLGFIEFHGEIQYLQKSSIRLLQRNACNF